MELKTSSAPKKIWRSRGRGYRGFGPPILALGLASALAIGSFSASTALSLTPSQDHVQAKGQPPAAQSEGAVVWRAAQASVVVSGGLAGDDLAKIGVSSSWINVSSASQGLTEPDPAWLAETSRITGIPARPLRAYWGAAATLARTQPGCQLGWPTLAGIGLVESNHSRFQGSALDENGVAQPAILGPVLNGEGFAGIRDTDGGRLDGDRDWDRAMGPMQFIPSTWARWGTDANADGKADPQNIDDAVISAARYLCASGMSMASSEGWMQAVLSYNHSVEYTRSVRSAADRYASLTGEPNAPAEPPLSSEDTREGGRGESPDPAEKDQPQPESPQPDSPKPESPKPESPKPAEPEPTAPAPEPSSPPASSAPPKLSVSPTPSASMTPSNVPEL